MHAVYVLRKPLQKSRAILDDWTRESSISFFPLQLVAFYALVENIKYEAMLQRIHIALIPQSCGGTVF